MKDMNTQDTDFPDYEVIISGQADTVWINGPDGSCVGRFGLMGVDLHTTVSEQMDGASQCRLCTHGKPTPEDWTLFREKASEWWNVEIPADTVDPRCFSWTAAG
ncbi:hypothetical protein QAO71_17030 (plasmid) [Halopseudomonas sp. SMJS2]|uniref:hypothetical protein n=1 Tax=Halopseudomonas sp. SMJS2 TaxID=3041098 RepID=UPI0024533A65|nr:hypothetical protein [Halopseudomonas sp. SMJS2]WGK63474.1 hypothetical protein QAO71_17030 [Halopseudomonas sp. SMJS2]